MSELVFVKEPRDIFHIESNGTKQKVAFGEVVVAIASSGSKTLWDYDHKRTGRETEEVLLSGSDKTHQKIVEFFERTRAAAPNKRPFFNCHHLAIHALSDIDVFSGGYEFKKNNREFSRYSRWAEAAGVTAPLETVPCEAYAVMTSEWEVTHTIVGIDRPGYCLTVLESCNSMFIMENIQTLRAYDGDSLRHTLPSPTKWLDINWPDAG